jgi:hypothetical protein
MVLKFPLVARDDVNDGRRPFERKRAWGDCGGESTALMPLVPLVCCLDEVGLGDSMMGVEGCRGVIVSTESVDDARLTGERTGDGEGGLSGFGDSSKTSCVLRPVEMGVVGVTRVGVDTAEMEGVDSASGKDFLITGAGLTVASGTVWR